VRRLELSRGRRPDTIRGAAIGLAVGAAGEAFIGFAGSSQQCNVQQNYCSPVAPGLSPGGEAVLFGAIGAALGAVIGSLHHHDRWEGASFSGFQVSVTAQTVRETWSGRLGSVPAAGLTDPPQAPPGGLALRAVVSLTR